MIEEEYAKSKDAADYRAFLLEQEKHAEEQRGREAAERVQIEREIKKAKQQADKEDIADRRLQDRKLEIEKMKRDLLMQKQQLLQNVGYAQQCMGNEIKSEMWLQ